MSIGNIIWPLLRGTILNPALTGPALLARIATTTGPSLNLTSLTTRPHTPLDTTLIFLFTLSLARSLNTFLSSRARNNWTTSTFTPASEIILVTGGSSGIGRAIVQAFAAHTPKAICILDVQPPAFPLPANTHFYPTDITSAPALSTTGATIRAAHGAPTVLVNNAGLIGGKTILDTPSALLHRVFDVNIIAHFLTVREFLPAMIAADHGHVVTIASLASFVGIAQGVEYCCTKAAALAFDEGLSQELRHRYGARKVRTSVFHPGFVRTPLLDGMGGEMGQLMEAGVVAEEVVRQVVSGRGAQVTVPSVTAFYSAIRGWPGWLQEGARDRTRRMFLGAGEKETATLVAREKMI